MRYLQSIELLCHKKELGKLGDVAERVCLYGFGLLLQFPAAEIGVGLAETVTLPTLREQVLERGDLSHFASSVILKIKRSLIRASSGELCHFSFCCK